MGRTGAWMRDYFVSAWALRLATLGVGSPGLQEPEQWCQKERVQVLYEFRKSKVFTSELLQRLLRSGYSNFTRDSTLFYNAFVAVLFTVVNRQPRLWDAKPDYFMHLFLHMTSLNQVQLQGLAEQGRLLREGNIDPHLNEKVMNIIQIVP